MHLLTLAGLFFGSAALASPAAPKMYDLDLKVERNGKPFASPRLSVIEGEVASVTDTNDKGSTFVEAVVKEHGKRKAGEREQVLVELTVGAIDAKGKRTVYGKPQIIALENETASMTMTEKRRAAGKKSAGDELSVSVTARPEYQF